MTLAEKAGQMTQVANVAMANRDDIAAYAIGGMLSVGGSGPDGLDDPR